MTNNKNNSASELNDPQGIDRSLLEYLKPKSEDRYSKLEAYCDRSQERHQEHTPHLLW